MKDNQIVEKLINAEKTKKQIDFISEKNKLTEIECYEIQKELVKQKRSEFNSEQAGYKISMTSPETQAIANTHEPAYGTYLGYNIMKETQTIKIKELFEPLLEPELVFQLNEDLSEEVDHSEIIRKSSIYMGAEIPDSRYFNWFPNFNLIDLICDNAFTGRLVLSEEIFPASEIEFKNISLQLYHDNELIKEGSSNNVLGNPLNSIVWLNKKLVSQGNKLRKGLMISSGTFTTPIKLSSGSYTLKFSSLGSMKVKCL